MNHKHTFTPNYMTKYHIVRNIVRYSWIKQQTTWKNTHRTAYYINNPCLIIDTKSMLIMDFVRKNSSRIWFPYARNTKAQGFMRE